MPASVTSLAVSPRTRVWLVIAAASVAAAGAAVGVTLATRTPTQQAVEITPRPRPGFPPLVLDLGVRTDAEARALRRAAALYDRGRRSQAARVFAGYRSLEAQLGSAFAAWRGTLPRIRALAEAHPRSAVAQLHLGLALFWAGRAVEAASAWRRAVAVEPDTLSAVRAGDLLHPNFPRGLPIFVPSFPAPPQLRGLSPPRQLAFLAQRARTGGVHEKLLYGVALQRLGRQLSAERQYTAAATLAPRDPEAQVAAAVGRFDKEHPERAFSRLGPLTRTFPRAPSVRFHLGLLLLWLGKVEAGKRQLRLAREEAPSSALGYEAQRFLVRLANVGTKRQKR